MEYGLIGKNVTFSYSEFIHHLIGNKSYSLLSLNENEFVDYIKEKRFIGLNVTMPYKEIVLPYIDELNCDISVINTIVHRENKLIGYNTDIDGFSALLDNNHIQITGKKVLILGTGGTSKTVKKVLIDKKASQIYFVSRNQKKGALTYVEAEEKYDIDVIVNTTPYGMYPNYEKKALIELSKFPYLEAVIDVVYNPLRTTLLMDAKKRDIKVVSGLEMLVEQACCAEELFLNIKISKTMRRSIYRQTLLKLSNLVLIGMPASGKTTIGMSLARKLNMDFFDSDREIERLTKMKINDIFAIYGEAYFRKIEAQVIKELSSKIGVVISIGGGSLLNEESADMLMRNSTLIFLNRDISFFKRNQRAKKTRPLLNKENAIDKLFNERYNIYRKYADIEIVSNGTKLNTLNKILEALL